jgi:hypothetical protein
MKNKIKMKPLKTSALALCLASLFTPLLSKAQVLDPTQVYTTGNIVQNTPQGGPTPWVGGVYQDQLTCWRGGDPGYCGPNAIVRPGNVINFSYGSTYLFQQQHIANVLPPETGLQVNGYNFGFRAKNGNGWDDGRTDQLTALVRFWDNTGGRGSTNLLHGDVYSLNYKFNWTNFNYDKTFTKPLAVPSIGQVQYGFIGRDNNGWAGPYGPEVVDVSFRLKYSVDPCVSNVLSSPSCPGYLDALAKLAPQTISTSLTTETTPVGTTTIVDGVVAITPTGTATPPGSSTTSNDTQPASTQQSSSSSTSTSNPSQQASSSSQPTTNNSQTRVGEVSDSSGGSRSTVSLSSVLSMISSNREKTNALERSVVQSADAQAFAAGEGAKQQAEKIAGDVQAQSIANSGGSQTGTATSAGLQNFGPQTQGSLLMGNLQFDSASNSSRAQQASMSSGSIQNDGSIFNATNQQQINTQSNVRQQEFIVSIIQPSTSYALNFTGRQSQQMQIEIPSLEGIRFGNKSPVEEAMEPRPILPQTNTGSQQGDSVKRNVQNNEAAGNVSIESIAKQPVGYAQYFGMMPDVAFYSPREIYRNQKTVDNVRVMRGLSGGSDRLHQEMINQQYK